MLSGLSLFLRKSEPEWHLSIRNSIPHETWTKMWKKTTHRIEIRLVSCVALPFSILCVAISPQYLLFGPNGSRCRAILFPVCAPLLASMFDALLRRRGGGAGGA